MAGFQFLIGTLKTFFSFSHSFFALEFQFLIGTLKTNRDHVAVDVVVDLFQFLIGTLKTLLSAPIQPGQARFQFLIGTLKTMKDYVYPEPGSSSFNSS